GLQVSISRSYTGPVLQATLLLEFVHRASMDVAQSERDDASVPEPPHTDREEPAPYTVEAVVARVLAGGTPGVGIAGCADGELVHLAVGVHRVILPVAVAVEVEELVGEVRLDPLAELVALIRKGHLR